MPTAWITGAGGLIGSHLLRSASIFAPGWQIAAPARAELDIAHLTALTSYFAAVQPRFIIHCAALSRVAECEASPDRADFLNVVATQHLARLAADRYFLFVSTDVVFDGRRGGYLETDPVGPLSVYARTKAEAEQHVLRNPRHAVVRLSLNTGASPTGDRSFTEQMYRAWARGDTLTCFTDEFRCPLPAEVTARALWELTTKSRPGLYHLGGAERLSRHAIAALWARRWPELKCDLQAGSVLDYRGIPRPADTSLDCAKIQALLSFKLPGLSEWLAARPEVTR